jgi:phospholipid/cholesterol/gamma-HCH transport system substrate-binding protein
MKKKAGSNWKLGVFVTAGLLLFIITIYYVGKQKNLFGSTFHLKSTFKSVSGLKEGNNVRFSGINIGTVNTIQLLTDTSVIVDIVVRKEYQKFIKTDAMTSVGSDGLMGDKVFVITSGISAGQANSQTVKNNDMLASKVAIEMEDVMKSLKSSVDNAGIITAQFAEFSVKMNSGNGPLSKLISDEELANSISRTVSNLESGSNKLALLIGDKNLASSIKQTVANLEASSEEFAVFTTNLNEGELGKSLDSTLLNIKGATKGLDENMEALQSNFLLRGFFNKKKKAEAKRLEDLKKIEDKIKKEQAKKTIDSIKAIKIVPSVINIKDTIRQ